MSVTFDHEFLPFDLGLNVSNMNAVAILTHLGIVVDDGLYGEHDAVDFVRRSDEALFAMELDSLVDAGVRPTRVTTNHIDCGLRPGYFTDRIGELRELAAQAASLGIPLRWA